MKLYQYQKKGVRQIEHFEGRALLADEMGLGKTVQALEWLRRHPNLHPITIICPTSLKWVWEHHVSLILKMKAFVAKGQTPPAGKTLNKPQILIIDYDILFYWKDYLKKRKNKALLIDEAHYIKNSSANRSRATKVLAKDIPYIIGITGTPLTNKPNELWNIISIIRPDKYKQLWPFRWRYCAPKRKPWGWEFNGASHLDELHTNLKNTMMIRRLKKNVLTELPAKTRIVITVDIKRKEYEEATNNFLSWLTKISPAAAERAKSAERLVQFGYLKRLTAELKLKNTLNWIKNFLEEDGGKLVVFAVHKKIINAIHSKFPKSVVITGETKQKNRKNCITTFQKDPKFRLFIGNIQAAGVGITLTAASSLLFAELDWVPAQHTQAEDRIHRIGQKAGVMIYYIIAKNTIEEDLCKLIQKKQKIISQVLDGKTQKDDLNIYDEIEKKLKRRRK